MIYALFLLILQLKYALFAPTTGQKNIIYKTINTQFYGSYLGNSCFFNLQSIGHIVLDICQLSLLARSAEPNSALTKGEEMPKESKSAKRKRALEICHRLNKLYGNLGSALNYDSPYTLLISVMLSAQTTDRSVNKVTPRLFSLWPGPIELAGADEKELEDVIHPLGFYHTKARHAIECAQAIVGNWDGKVPDTMEGLTSLPGVGRKTANIVLNKAFGKIEGIAVDTHVYRIATRLAFTTASTPLAAEQDLLAIIPHELWGSVNETWIRHGRNICSSRAPKCEICPLGDLCPSKGHITDHFNKKHNR
jgi:endonuclease-3